MSGPPPKGARVAVYARAALMDQQEIGIQPYPAVVDQIALCRLFAEGHEWDVIAVYTDAPQSGLQMGQGLLQMMGDAAARLFDVMLVRDLDRFGRNPEPAQSVLDDLGAVGVVVGVVPDPPALCDDCARAESEGQSHDD